jgi:hypothetical protein
MRKPNPITDVTVRPGMVERFLAHVAIDPAHPVRCWLWTGPAYPSQSGDLYGRFYDGTDQHLAHRWSLAHLGGVPLPPRTLVCHHCDVPLCVRPSHLYVGSEKTNAQDRDTRHRRDTRPGERHHFAQLTEAQVAEIRARYAAGGSHRRGVHGTVTQPMLAAEYGVSRQAIGKVVRGERWRHVS